MTWMLLEHITQQTQGVAKRPKDTACSVNNDGNASLFYGVNDEWEEDIYDLESGDEKQ